MSQYYNAPRDKYNTPKRSNKKRRGQHNATGGLPVKKVASIPEPDRNPGLWSDPDFSNYFQNPRTIRTIDPTRLEQDLAERKVAWCGENDTDYRGRLTP